MDDNMTLEEKLRYLTTNLRISSRRAKKRQEKLNNMKQLVSSLKCCGNCEFQKECGHVSGRNICGYTVCKEWTITTVKKEILND
jgi:hypothetical protein